ncbi:SDR family oxidoreductase [Herbidospora cretacea]|uniref:SDR family oxidoreductase n=1 Tax=Herbidospora cretacea TaxID=28444 RepID=UPI000774E159|nr:NAD(P)H-binding protein [Herbidospora cretacea]
MTHKVIFEPEPILDFFTTSTRTLLNAGREAGVRHHVVLSIVGVDRLSHPGYLDAKAAQERLVAESDTPFTIVSSTTGQPRTPGSTTRYPRLKEKNHDHPRARR